MKGWIQGVIQQLLTLRTERSASYYEVCVLSSSTHVTSNSTGREEEAAGCHYLLFNIVN